MEQHIFLSMLKMNYVAKQEGSRIAAPGNILQPAENLY
jgi:hypothetical protein